MWIAINIANSSHLLKRIDFDAVVDHIVLTHIMKSKSKPATNTIKRLLEVLSSYMFSLYYLKGKDMIVSNFLVRMEGDKSVSLMRLFHIIEISPHLDRALLYLFNLPSEI